MSKFKEGDRVVVLTESAAEEAFKGKVATVTGYSLVGNCEIMFDEEVVGMFRTAADWDSPDENLELESVYNSPLYKALS